MERVLPPGAIINQEAVDAVDRCVAQFAGMLTTVATEERKEERREVMSVGNLIKALDMLGYDHYIRPLTEYLERYRESKGTVGHRRQQAMDAVAPETWKMALVAKEMPPHDLLVQSQVPETAVVTREMPPTPPHPSDLTSGLPMYDFMARDPAPAAATAAMGEMPPTPPHPSDFALALPMYDATVRAQTRLATGELGLNTNISALWSGAGTSHMPPSREDE
jgi:hypothetical protein